MGPTTRLRVFVDANILIRGITFPRYSRFARSGVLLADESAMCRQRSFAVPLLRGGDCILALLSFDQVPIRDRVASIAKGLIEAGGGFPA